MEHEASASNDAKRGEKWPRVNFPNGFVHPYTHVGKDGKTYKMMRVSIPEGTMLHGLEIGGWQVDAFMGGKALEEKANGRPVTVSFRPGRPIELWKGAGRGRETTRVNDPWDLCKAVKRQRLEYTKSLSGNRVTQKPNPDDVIPERGEFVGDGIPRTFGGEPYDPLRGYPKPKPSSRCDIKNKEIKMENPKPTLQDELHGIDGQEEIPHVSLTKDSELWSALTEQWYQGEEDMTRHLTANPLVTVIPTADGLRLEDANLGMALDEEAPPYEGYDWTVDGLLDGFSGLDGSRCEEMLLNEGSWRQYFDHVEGELAHTQYATRYDAISDWVDDHADLTRHEPIQAKTGRQIQVDDSSSRAHGPDGQRLADTASRDERQQTKTKTLTIGEIKARAASHTSTTSRQHHTHSIGR